MSFLFVCLFFNASGLTAKESYSTLKGNEAPCSTSSHKIILICYDEKIIIVIINDYRDKLT